MHTCIGITSPANPLTQTAQARRVVELDNVSFDSHLRVWNVKGTSGTPRVVTLYPKESCSCPSTSNCYHIIAVKMALGQNNFSEQKHITLTQLRKRSKSKKDKKSGKKKPREGDIDGMSKIDKIHWYARCTCAMCVQFTCTDIVELLAAPKVKKEQQGKEAS